MTVDVIPLLVGLGVLFTLLVADVPIAFCLGIAGATGIAMMLGVQGAASSLASIPFNTTSSYTLTVVPMFILMGLMVSHSGMIDGIFNIAQRLTRRMPGGLGISTVMAATFFGGISGSSVADSATIGRVSIGEMSKRGYDKAYAAAIVAAAGTVSILIPPSVPLVMYGIVSGASIGKLLLAGIIPGLLTAAVYIAMIVVISKSGKSGRGQAQSAVEAASRPALPPVPLEEYVGLAAGALLFAIVVGGLYTGIFTATEAGALGALAALLVSVIYVVTWGGKRGLTLRTMLLDAFCETGALSSMIFALIVGASIFSNFLVLANVPTAVSAWVVSQDIPPALVVASLLAITLPMGMFIDGMSMLLIAVPLFHPVVQALGYDGIWFGILFIKCVEIGLLTPPVGLNVFVVAGLFDDIRVDAVFRRIAPFIVAELIVLVLMFVFPGIITYLPSITEVK